MRISDTIILKRNKYDIREDYNDSNLRVVTRSSKNNILKYNFINIFVII